MAQDTKFVRGAGKLSQRIKTISAKLALPVLTEEIGEFILRRTLDSFDKEEDPDGNSWKQLARSTLRRNPNKILNRTGELRAAIGIIRGTNAGTLASATGAGVRIGISDPKQAKIGRFQNFGTSHIPARRFLGIGVTDIKAVDSYLRRKGNEAMA